MALNRTCKYYLDFILKSGLREPILKLPTQQIQCARNMSKHWHPKWKLLRKLKVVKIKVPDFHRKEKPYEEMTKDEIRSRLKEMGMRPKREWSEHPVFIGSTGGIFEPYVPPEGDGKMSIISKEGAKQKIELFSKKSKSMMSVRKIRNYDEDFEPKDFVQDAQQIYINAHTALQDRKYDELEKLVTERAFLEMINNTEYKTMRWKFLGSIDPPRMVHCRDTNVVSDTNVFVQATVRFHSQQMLAIYDRFGRLMYGSEILAKDVLEYVVFEKHLASQYGIWRIHGKIIPDWMGRPEPAPKTYKIPDAPPPTPPADTVEPDTATTEVIQPVPSQQQAQPATA